MTGAYELMCGEPFVSQIDSPNRQRDAARISQRLGLAEEGNPTTEFFTKAGTLIARGYLRIVYGDHGPYLEFLPNQMVREAWRLSVKKGPQAWYDECQPKDGSNCKLYVQKRDVKMLRNPPRGRYSVNNNRLGGYADYRVGRLYISPDDISLAARTPTAQLPLFQQPQRLTPPTGLVIAGTGHRTEKLGGYNQGAEQKVLVVARHAIANAKPSRVISGMALGWDTALALAALESQVPLIAAVPFEGFDSKWPTPSRRVYQSILEKAQEIVVVDKINDGRYQELNNNIPPGIYSSIKLQTRNVWMVDNCEHLLALWDGSSGGTANCLKYARTAKREWTNFWSFFGTI